MSTKETELTRLAEEQFGVFTFAQARAVGYTQHEIKWRLGIERWRRVYDDVYRIAGTPASWRGDVLAACFAGGADAVASHRSAAALWGFAGGRTDLVEITCPRWRRARHAGLVVHESKILAKGATTVIDGVPVTTPETTLMMLGAVASPLVVEMAIDKGLRTGLLTLDSTRTMLTTLGRRGRNGVGVLRAILHERDPDHRPTDSEMETMLRRVLRRNDLPVPVPQYEIYDGLRFVARVDFAYVHARIAIEYESAEHHSGLVALERDNPRRNALVAAGWKPLGVTARDLRADGGLRLSNLLHSLLASPVGI